MQLAFDALAGRLAVAHDPQLRSRQWAADADELERVRAIRHGFRAPLALEHGAVDAVDVRRVETFGNVTATVASASR